MLSRLTTFLMLSLALIICAAPGARAQIDGSGTSYLTSFPDNDVYKVLLVGDDLAEGLLSGMTEAFAGDTRVDVVKKHQVITGLTRNDFDDRVANLDETLGREPANVAVVMIGAWDRNQLKAASGKRVPVGSQEWRAEYSARLDKVMKVFKKRNVAVYWVGLPNVRKSDADDDVKMMNEQIRERIYINGMRYIDAYAGFVDEQGGFSAYGPDQTGKMRLLREGEGVYFTSAGNLKLAHFVERELKRDLTQAKADRNVPLAGNEAEQARINPQKAAAAKAASASQSAPASGADPSSTSPTDAAPPGTTNGANAWQSATTTAPAPAETPIAADQKADNGKISLKLVNQAGREEVVALDIVRPAISASVVALVTRRESADKPTQMGEQLVDQIAGGLTVMSSVTPSSTAAAAGGRRLSPTQSPYYRVLLKGERLTPRKGRADDFSWPRPEGPVTRASTPPVPVPRDPTATSASDVETATPQR